MRQIIISTAFAAGLVFSSGARAQTSGPAIAAQQPASVISTCAYRKSSPIMQSTQDRTAQNAPRCLGGT
jgi:hypothetical protein